MWGVNLGMWSPLTLWKYIASFDTKVSSVSFQHSFCCDFPLILLGINLPAQLAGNKVLSIRAKTVAEFEFHLGMA